MSLSILYANGEVQAVQLFVWDGVKPVLWDGAITGGSGFQIPQSDAIYLAQPDATHDVFTYKLSGVTVGTVTVTYTGTRKDPRRSRVGARGSEASFAF